MAGKDQEGFLKISIDDFIGMWCFCYHNNMAIYSSG